MPLTPDRADIASIDEDSLVNHVEPFVSAEVDSVLAVEPISEPEVVVDPVAAAEPKPELEVVVDTVAAEPKPELEVVADTVAAEPKPELEVVADTVAVEPKPELEVVADTVAAELQMASTQQRRTMDTSKMSSEDCDMYRLAKAMSTSFVRRT